MEEWPQINGIDKYINHVKGFSRSNSSDFDPYQVLLSRKNQETNQNVVEYDPNDIYELQQFCQKYGIVGFNMGKMNPKAALSILKRKIGIVEAPTPPPVNSKLLCG